MIGQKIKVLRVQNGMTQDDLAKKMGFGAKSSISRIERGNTDVNQKMLKRFAEVFGVDETYFFDFEQDYTLNHLLYEKSKGLSKEQLNTLIKLVESMK